MRLSTLLLVITFLSACKSKVPDQDPVSLSQSITPYPEIKESPLSLGLAGYAKVLCSAVFISGRDPEEAITNSGYFLLPDELWKEAEYIIDTEEKSATLSIGDTLFRKAKYYGSQGCIICRDNKDTLDFQPVEVSSSLPPADQLPWPMGDKDKGKPLPPEIIPSVVEEALDLAFSPDEALTMGMIILYKGQIVGERYANGVNKDTQLESWSMGKSITATLVGRMIRQGYFNLEDKSLFHEWSSSEDPRSEIRVIDLLQMSSGLKFSAHQDPGAEERTTYLDHFYIYTGAIDAYEFSLNRPLEFNVGTEGRYRNCDPLLLGRLIKQHLKMDQKSYLLYPQKELFDKIGIRRQVLETDPFGNFLLTGYDYGTVRNWARLGQLYLQDGVWNDERLLPEGWSAIVSTPAPAWKDPVYGGLFWVNGNEELPLPKNTYFMAGAGGQYTVIIPDYEIVVVRMGHFRGGELAIPSLIKSILKFLSLFQ